MHTAFQEVLIISLYWMQIYGEVTTFVEHMK